MLLIFFSSSVFSSVCFTTQNPKIFEYSSYVGDLNDDGISDKYEIYDESSSISISQNGVEFQNISIIDESWAIDASWMKSNYGIESQVISFDVNNDNLADIVAAFGSRIVIRKNNSTNDFSVSEQYISLNALYGSDVLALDDSKIQYGAKLIGFDINSDGYKDLVIIHSDGVTSLLNDTTGNFSLLETLILSGFSEKDIDGVFVSELASNLPNGIVISTRGSYIISFDDSLHMNVISIPNTSDKIDPIDFENDGDIDFVENQSYDFCQVPSAPDQYRYWVNNGDGTFSLTIQNLNDGVIVIDPIIIELPESEEESEKDTVDTSNTESGKAFIGGIDLVTLLILFMLAVITGLTRCINADCPQLCLGIGLEEAEASVCPQNRTYGSVYGSSRKSYPL